MSVVRVDSNMRVPSLTVSGIVTAIVVGIPTATGVYLAAQTAILPAASITVVVAIALSWITFAWALHVGFDPSTVMLWSALQRRHRDRAIHSGTSLLGFDPAGRRVSEPLVPVAEQMTILAGLMEVLERKDPYTRGHVTRVERHAHRIGLELGLRVSEIEDLRKAASIHDVGKVAVPIEILRKPGELTDEERRQMEKHPVVGEAMVTRLGVHPIADAVRHHHERWDGRGYPDGLAGADIPIYSRIITVADTFDAVTSARSYRSAASRDRAISILEAERGKQFDPEIVDAFIATLPRTAPIAALVGVLLPTGALRRLADWWRGPGTIASGTAAVGATLTLGVSLFAPSALSHAPQDQVKVALSSQERVAHQTGDSKDTHDKVLGKQVEHRHHKHHDAPAPSKEPKEHRNRSHKPNKDRSHSQGHGHHGNKSDDGAAPPIAAPPEGQGKETPDPVQSSAPSVTPEPSGSGSENDNHTPDPKGDPQEDHGDDCDGHGHGDGNGHDYHCD